MRSLERRFKIEEDKNPLLSSLVNFGHAVQHQRFSRAVIEKWFFQLVDSDDYEKKDADAVIDHMLNLSHSPKVEDNEEHRA